MSSHSTKKINTTTAIIIGMNAMIGAGIFSLTCALASHVGPAGIITYLFSFLAIWFMANSLARVAYLYPQEGSFYIYAKQYGGHSWGLFVAGSYISGMLMAMGLLCKFSGIYLHQSFPQMSAYLLGLITLFVLTIANLLGLVLSQWGQYLLIICTVFPLLTTTALCLSKINFANLSPFIPYGPLSIITTTKIAVFGFFGFECTTSLFNILENPEKNISKAVTGSLLAVGIIYFLFILSMILSIPMTVFQSNENITITDALRTIFPHNTFILHCINFSIISAIIGTIHSMIWASSELLLSYVKFLNITTNRFISHRAIVIFIFFIILLAYIVIENYEIFFSLIAVLVIFSIIASIVPLLLLKNEWKSGKNIYTIIGLLLGLVIFSVAVETLVKNVIKIIS
ncbi:amino acid permease [Candidatus Dependentiae bacterium]|nr:amino acid permease [Candidatus Dependentiae bacterium]